MPIFEYRCSACGKRFEILQSRGEDAAPHCPQCGRSDPERLLSAFAPLTGSGAAAPGPCGSAACACMRQEPAS